MNLKNLLELLDKNQVVSPDPGVVSDLIRDLSYSELRYLHRQVLTYRKHINKQLHITPSGILSVEMAKATWLLYDLGKAMGHRALMARNAGLDRNTPLGIIEDKLKDMGLMV